MFTCICRAVTTETIEAAIQAGVKTVEGIMMLTGAGTGCGSCVERIEELLGIVDV